IKVEAIGRVYGDVYKSRLLSRPINDATVVNDSLNILWGSLSDTTIIGTEVKYIDNNDEPRLFFIDKSVLLSMTPDFSRGDIEYRTVYLPVNAIDTFYTDWVGMYVKGQRRSEEHTSELQSRENLVCRLLLEKKKCIT